MSKALLPLLTVTFFIVVPVRTASAEEAVVPGTIVTLWTRAPGHHSDGREPNGLEKRVINLATHAKQKKVLTDLQYEGTFSFKAISLVSIVEAYPQSAGIDRILLHFKNGMITPLPLEPSRSTLKKVNGWIATSWKPLKTEKWSTTFDDIGRIDERFRDPSPITFGFNKFVVKNKWHPFVTDPAFSPFRHAETLTGIEFVNGAAYDRQFVSTDDFAGADGWNVFASRCQYCHGPDRTGATHGWGFLTPVPIYQLRTAENLYYRVKYSYHDAMLRGMQMPNQDSIKMKETVDLRNWLKGFAKKKINAYRP